MMEIKPENIIIPHAPPFIFVDSIVNINSRSIICNKRIEREDQYLVYKSGEKEYISQAALIECVLQSGAYLMTATASATLQNTEERKMYFIGSPEITFGANPDIDDILNIEVEVIQKLRKMARLQGKILCNSKLVLKGTFIVAEK